MYLKLNKPAIEIETRAANSIDFYSNRVEVRVQEIFASLRLSSSSKNFIFLVKVLVRVGQQ